MYNRSESASTISIPFYQNGSRRIIHSFLSKIKFGGLTIKDGLNTETYFGDRESNFQASIEVNNPRFYQRLLFGGSIAAAESYIDGDWTSNDLTKVLQLMAENLSLLDKIESRISWVIRPINRIIHWLHRNKPAQAKQNIAAHYDLGNDFYQAFLDNNMLYSSAIFTNQTMTLEQAQIAKMRRLCDQLELKPEDHLLEIGSGWGGLAEFAAREYGCKVTTTTISQQQYNYSCQRIADAGLNDRVNVLFEDYRYLQGQFDKLVSVEMIEAVGKNYLPLFFKRCQQLLKPNGKMALQAITIADHRYDNYSQGVDFIQRYIFPGGFLPSMKAIKQLIAQHTDLAIHNQFDMGQDYALTLAIWRQRFLQQWSMLQKIGFEANFQRLWLFYFCYCEAGFLAKTISTVQLTAVRS